MSTSIFCFKDLKKELGFESSKNLPDVLYGNFNGYFITIVGFEELRKIQISCGVNLNYNQEESSDSSDSSDSSVVQSIQRELNSFSQSNSFISTYLLDENTVVAEIKFVNSIRKDKPLHDIRSILNHMINTLNANRVLSGCRSCGCREALSPINIYNQDVLYVCMDCYAKMQHDLSKEQIALSKQPSNILLGSVGAFLGSLIGGIAWVVIYQFGYVAGLAGLIAFGGAYSGYHKFSQKKNLLSIFIPLFVCLFTLFLANGLCWTIDIYRTFSSELGITILDALVATPEFIFVDAESMRYFFGELLIGYALLVASAVGPIISFFKQARYAQKIEKL